MVTIKEIAKAVGVSSATVSRVLNYDPTLSISEVKRQAVIETAEALNYATPRNRNKNGAPPPSVALSSLVIVHSLEQSEELADPYYVGVRLGIENRCKDLKTDVIKVFHSDQQPDSRVLREASGVISIGRQTRKDIDWLRANCRNLVFADFDPSLEEVDFVLSDLKAATKRMLETLCGMGYRRIGFLGSHENSEDENVPYGELRCKAYIEWCNANNCFEPELLALGDDCNAGHNLRLETGYAVAKAILAQKDRPDAVITANDNMAIGAYRAIHEAGLSIPDDIAVASFNDIPVAQFLNPPLSTVRIESEHIGEAAVDLLLEQVAGREYAKHVFIPSQTVWRDSSRKPVKV